MQFSLAPRQTDRETSTNPTAWKLLHKLVIMQVSSGMCLESTTKCEPHRWLNVECPYAARYSASKPGFVAIKRERESLHDTDKR